MLEVRVAELRDEPCGALTVVADETAPGPRARRSSRIAQSRSALARIIRRVGQLEQLGRSVPSATIANEDRHALGARRTIEPDASAARARRRRTQPTRSSTVTSRARAAPRRRRSGTVTFRVVWLGTFASNIGTWMQNVLLGAYGYTLTHSETYVGLLFFAQLGPLLLLSNVGGVLADIVDRRKLLLAVQAQQLVFSILLAVLTTGVDPSRRSSSSACWSSASATPSAHPRSSSILPTLVPRPDLPGAVSLQSVQMNLSRVIGPAIGAAIYAGVGAAPVFLLNAGTYLFAVAAILSVATPRRHSRDR